MAPRFHVPDLDAAATRVRLPDDEAAHLVRVLRLRAGAEVEVFDGRGGAWRGEVVEAGRRSAWVAIGPRCGAARETRARLTLAAAVLKGDKMDAVVRDAVMMGVHAIQPLVTARAETRAATLDRARRVERWQRVAVASAKQCGRAVVPQVHDPLAFDRYLATPVAVRLMCVEPGAAAGAARGVSAVPAAAAADVLVGPEGGWTDDEVAMAAAGGAVLVSLGSRTLRADATPLVAVTALLTCWQDL